MQVELQSGDVFGWNEAGDSAQFPLDERVHEGGAEKGLAHPLAASITGDVDVAIALGETVIEGYGAQLAMFLPANSMGVRARGKPDHLRRPFD